MTDHTDLINKLRDTASRGVSVWGDLQMEAADALEAAQAEIANLHTVMMAAAVEISEHWDAHCDAEGYGPVNLLRRLENGYPDKYGYDSHTVVRMEKERDAALARLAAIEKQEPVGYLYDWVHSSATGRDDETYTGFTKDKAHAEKHDNAIAIYAAAGASPVQPSQADAQDAARYRWLREYLPSDDLQYDDNLVLAKTGEDIDAAIDAAINAKGSK